jgi:hypothetical protein
MGRREKHCSRRDIFKCFTVIRLTDTVFEENGIVRGIDTVFFRNYEAA